MTSLSATNIGSVLAGGMRWRRPALVLLMLVLADFLFFGHEVGISAVLFLLVLSLAALAAVPGGAYLRGVRIAGGIVLAAAVPAVLAPTPLAIAILMLATAHFALAATGRAGTRLFARIDKALGLWFDGCWEFVSDLGQDVVARKPDEIPRIRLGFLVVWVVPVVLGGLFLVLFSSANPLIEDWFTGIELGAVFDGISGARLGLWLVTVAAVWPFLHTLRRNRTGLLAGAASALDLTFGQPKTDELKPSALPSALFGKAAILRSLVLFNLLFAVQTVLDLAYLWGGAELPDGTTYAGYAHRGAYPLIATALLAAAFVLAAMRPGSETGRSRLIRMLVFLWVGQNVLLVVSSMLRLDLYVAVYSLTYLRVAAFVWMLLVVIGLVLIVLRIALGRSNAWLFGMNLASVTLTLYLCGFVNFPSVIATYNVEHSQEVSGEGHPLDLPYLESLGPDAIPALDVYLAEARNPVDADRIAATLSRLARAHETRMADWRAWGYRDQQLLNYLYAGAW